jgi:hypothetical protein
MENVVISKIEQDILDAYDNHMKTHNTTPVVLFLGRVLHTDFIRNVSSHQMNWSTFYGMKVYEVYEPVDYLAVY